MAVTARAIPTIRRCRTPRPDAGLPPYARTFRGAATRPPAIFVRDLQKQLQSRRGPIKQQPLPRCSHRLAVRTSPSHGENWGSIPHGSAISFIGLAAYFEINVQQLSNMSAWAVVHSRARLTAGNTGIHRVANLATRWPTVRKLCDLVTDNLSAADLATLDDENMGNAHVMQFRKEIGIGPYQASSEKERRTGRSGSIWENPTMSGSAARSRKPSHTSAPCHRPHRSMPIAHRPWARPCPASAPHTSQSGLGSRGRSRRARQDAFRTLLTLAAAIVLHAWPSSALKSSSRGWDAVRANGEGPGVRLRKVRQA